MKRRASRPAIRKTGTYNSFTCPHCGDQYTARRPFIDSDGVELAYVHEYGGICTSDGDAGQARVFPDCYIDADA